MIAFFLSGEKEKANSCLISIGSGGSISGDMNPAKRIILAALALPILGCLLRVSSAKGDDLTGMTFGFEQKKPSYYRYVGFRPKGYTGSIKWVLRGFKTSRSKSLLSGVRYRRLISRQLYGVRAKNLKTALRARNGRRPLLRRRRRVLPAKRRIM